MTATLFFPRGGSAYVVRALARGLTDQGVDLTLLAGSRHDADGVGDAARFYRDLDLHELDFTAALDSPDPTAFAAGPPLHPSFEDRPGARDRIFAALGDAAFERQVDAWAEALEAVEAERADVLHLHHLTPLNEAARRVAPDVPIVGTLHGTELLMLEAIAAEPDRWPHAEAWRRRLCAWAAACERIVHAPGNGERVRELLAIAPERIVELPNGFDPATFHPREVDREQVWRRVLVEEPRGWRPGGEPGGVRYDSVDGLDHGPVILFVGRFTEVKRIPLLLEAFAAARDRFTTPARLILVGGHPEEWEGEHPAAAIDRLGLDGVFLAGWHDQSELPELLAACDLLVLPSARESFGQVIVEAMACGVPAVAAASLGPAQIIDDGETGWLFEVDDRAALAEALADAAGRPEERRRRAANAERAARERFAWPAIAGRLEEVLRAAAAARAPGAQSTAPPS